MTKKAFTVVMIVTIFVSFAPYLIYFLKVSGLHSLFGFWACITSDSTELSNFGGFVGGSIAPFIVILNTYLIYYLAYRQNKLSTDLNEKQNKFQDDSNIRHMRYDIFNNVITNFYNVPVEILELDDIDLQLNRIVTIHEYVVSYKQLLEEFYPKSVNNFNDFCTIIKQIHEVLVSRVKDATKNLWSASDSFDVINSFMPELRNSLQKLVKSMSNELQGRI